MEGKIFPAWGKQIARLRAQCSILIDRDQPSDHRREAQSRGKTAKIPVTRREVSSIPDRGGRPRRVTASSRGNLPPALTIPHFGGLLRPLFALSGRGATTIIFLATVVVRGGCANTHRGAARSFGSKSSRRRRESSVALVLSPPHVLSCQGRHLQPQRKPDRGNPSAPNRRR